MLGKQTSHDSVGPSANALVLGATALLSGTAAASLSHLGMDAVATLSGSLLIGLSVLMLGGWANALRVCAEARAAKQPS